MGRERNARLSRRWVRLMGLDGVPKIFTRVFRIGTQEHKAKLAAILRRDIREMSLTG